MNDIRPSIVQASWARIALTTSFSGLWTAQTRNRLLRPLSWPVQSLGANMSAPASSWSILLIMFCSGFVKPPDESVSVGNAPKLARYLSIAATLPTKAQVHPDGSA